MMSVSPISVRAVISNFQEGLHGTTLAPKSAAPQGESFSVFLEGIGKKTRDLLRSSEAQGKAAAAGYADPQVVSLEVLRAREALHQLSVLVNTSLQSYQEVMHMAI